MKYLLKFLLQTIVILVYTPVFLCQMIWEWKVPDTEIYRLYHRKVKWFIWVMGGRYTPKPKPTSF